MRITSGAARSCEIKIAGLTFYDVPHLRGRWSFSRGRSGDPEGVGTMGEKPGSVRLVCAVLGIAGFAGAARADIPLFDWQVPPETIKPGLEKGYIPVPTLSDTTT